MRVMIAIVAVLCAAIASTATAGEPKYAGLTRNQAIDRAEKGFLALALAFGATTEQISQGKRFMDTHTPQATHTNCNGKPMWKVLWPQDSDPIYVNSAGTELVCKVKTKSTPQPPPQPPTPTATPPVTRSGLWRTDGQAERYLERGLSAWAGIALANHFKSAICLNGYYSRYEKRTGKHYRQGRETPVRSDGTGGEPLFLSFGCTLTVDVGELKTFHLYVRPLPSGKWSVVADR